MKAWVLAVALVSAAPALAQSFSSKQVSHSWNTSSDVSCSVTVEEPEGAMGEISQGGRVVFRAEIPFRWEPRDVGPYQFTVKTRGGETWTKELTVKAMTAHKLRVKLSSSSSSAQASASESAPAQAPAANAGPPSANVPVTPDTFSWKVERDVSCTVKVLEPEGATGEIWAGNRVVRRAEIPFLYSPSDVGFYKFVVRTADGKVWVKKLEVESMKAHQLRVKGLSGGGASASARDEDDAEPAPARPAKAASGRAMPDAMFARLTGAMREQRSEFGRMSLLESNVASLWFTVDQVGQLVDLFELQDHKLQVVKLTHRRLTDRENASQLLRHFSSRLMQDEVQELLGR
jgi:hypothetical protein